MTPQELKNSILQLAIQGRLVEQRPEEGTAEELYKQIQAEKQRLIKEGKIKREKPLPEITEDEKPFEIPESWKWTRLDDVVIKAIKRGKSPAYAAHSKTMVFAQKCNTKAGKIDLSLALFLDETKLAKYPESEFMLNNDIVINSTGNGTLGRVGRYRDSDNLNNMPLVADSHVTVIRASESVCNSYLFYCLKYYQPYMENLGSGSTNQTELSANIIRALLFPLPPLAEQKRIVAKIEELLPYIDRYEQAWSKLEDFNKRFPVDMQKSILQTAIQGKLVEQRPEEGTGEELYKQIQAEKQRLIKAKLIGKGKTSTPIPESELPFDLPETWKWIRLGDVLTSTDAGKSPQCENRCRKGKEWGVIKTTAVQDGYFLADENKVLPAKFQIQDSQIIHQGDFLITRAGPKNRTGIMCIVDEEPANIILSDKTVRLAYVRGMVEPKYLMCALSSPAMQHWVVDAMTGMAASQVNISQDKMWTFVLPLPPLAEQERIVAKLEELLPLCERLK